MAMAELPKPGVEVIQQFSTTSPTIAAPRLIPCVVGVCKQILEITNSDGTINSDAAVSTPAVANADLAENYTVSSLTLSLAIDGGPTQTKTIDTGIAAVSAATLVAAINAAGFSGVTAYVWVDPSTNNRLQLRSNATGSSKSITFKGGTIASQLGWSDAIGYTWYGTSSYIQDSIFLPQESFPDPRDIMDDLDIDETSIAAYVDLGTEIRELTDDSTFLYGDLGAGTIAIVDDADGDTLTPFVALADGSGAVNFKASPTAATITGTGDISTDVRVHNLALALQIDGGGLQVVTLKGKPIVSTDVATWTFDPAHDATLTLLVNGVSVVVTMAAGVTDLTTAIAAINTVSLAATGYNVAYDANADGTAYTAGAHHLGLWVGAVPTTTIEGAEVSVVSDAAPGADAGEMFTSVPVYQSNDKTGLATVVDSIPAQINAAMNETIATAPANFLVLTSNTSGYESKIEVHGAPTGSTTLLTNLGITAGSYYGTPFVARVGDYLYADSTFLGAITEIHPGGITGRLRLGTEQSTTASWSSWYIVAQNLEDETSNWGTTVPTPDFYVDTAGDAHIKHDFLRDALGAPIGTVNVGFYVTYTAVRKDVTSEATTGTPALVVFEDVDELEDAIGPITTANPLAYGMFIAMSNAANTQISGIGVDAVSSGFPYGTLAAFGKAFDFLETEEVYAIAVMSDEPLVHQAAKVHAVAMSLPAAKGERVAIVAQDRPTREYDTIVDSGTDGERSAAGKFDTKSALLSAALQQNDIDPTSITVSDGVFLEIETDSYRWNITGSVATGTILSINTTFVAGENDDSFYATGTFPDVSDETYSVKIRGATIANTTAGRNKEVETYVNIGQGYSSRRLWFLVTNGAYASVDGVISLVEGFYLTAAKAGQVAGNLPSAPLTNFAISGFTKVVGTNDRYTETQLNQIAYGGCDIIVQPGSGAPLVSRHQLTTNMASVEVREQSIVKALDFCSKFIRGGLRNFIGKYNITETFLDTLSAVVQGQIRYLSDNGVIAGGDLNNIIQDTTNPDTVLVDITLEVLYPCNYIRVTLII